MEGFGGSVTGGGRYDKMIGKFTGMEHRPAGFPSGLVHCNHSSENGFEVPGASDKKAFL